MRSLDNSRRVGWARAYAAERKLRLEKTLVEANDQVATWLI
jgi:hypothetical protein